jgi:putative acyl-CoA dehydrogenase
MKPNFFQDPGTLHVDLYAHDRALLLELKRRLPHEVQASMGPAWHAMGELTSSTLPRLHAHAEANPPTHTPYDPWGRRVDTIHTSDAWNELHDIAAIHGVVAHGYEQSLGAHARTAQAALIYLFAASSAMVSCPLAMTDAAARVLLERASPSLRARLVPRLLSREPATFMTSGQWMTERTGGSDVSATSTVARFLDESEDGPRYTLHGVKWFTSATTSGMALALARIVQPDGTYDEGSRGLSLFCVGMERDAHGALHGVSVNRLKDKLGTKPLPTAELTLDGVVGVRIGAAGRGVAEISTMLNITRLHNSLTAASYMRRAVCMAQQYAWQREAFGRPVATQPLHARTLAELDAVTAAAMSMSMECAVLLGKMEHGLASSDELLLLRALVPLTKLLTAKQAIHVVSEALECFGGAGYVEDVGVASMLRDVQVLSIWEGTTNVLALDLLRAEKREGGLSMLLKTLQGRCEALGTSGLAHQEVAPRVQRLLQDVSSLRAEDVEGEARVVAIRAGQLFQAVLLGEAAAVGGKDAKEREHHLLRAFFATSPL